MNKILLGGFLGGIILWVWGFVAWMVLPFHLSVMRAVPDESAVVEALRRSLPSKGVYVIPWMPSETSGMTPEQMETAMVAYTEKLRSGPNAMIFYNPGGKDPFMTGQMISGLFIFISTASIVSWLLSRSTAAAGSYLSGVIYCGMIGILVAVGTHLSDWNWMGFPFDWTRGLMLDSVVGWLLAGLGISAVVRQKRSGPA
ncbi:MAG TPA: hypothetical protein VJO14_08740 [Bacteroidota bacterium]|nr:hypothetical protein [Bacteroidota bacterium]